MKIYKRLLSVLKSLRLGVAGALAITVLPAFAHHSFAAYDLSKKVTVAGAIKSFQWTLPHSQLTLVVMNAQGESEEWVIEAGSPTGFVKQGWKKSDVKNGELVTVTLNPTRDNKLGGSMVRLVRSDGRVLRGVFDSEGGGGLPGAESPGVPVEETTR